jgi:hypothetical protein
VEMTLKKASRGLAYTVIGLLVVVCAAIYVQLVNPVGGLSSSAIDLRDVGSGSNSQSSSDAQASPGSLDRNQAAGATPGPASNPRFSGQTRVTVGDGWYEPTSEADAEWFNRNWYPTKDMIDAANALDIGVELPPDLVPRSSWDLVQARLATFDKSRTDQALATLRNGAAAGSTYALTAIGDYYEGTGRTMESREWYLAAYMRGDTRYAMRWPTGSPRDQQVVNQAVMIFYQLNETRARSGLPPLTIDLRPRPESAANN